MADMPSHRKPSCTDRQAQILRYYGYSGDVSKKQACKMIDKIAKAGWKRPDGKDHLKLGSGLDPWAKPKAEPGNGRKKPGKPKLPQRPKNQKPLEHRLAVVPEKHTGQIEHVRYECVGPEERIVKAICTYLQTKSGVKKS